VINQHPHVFESCVVGIPDGKWGEKVVAAVILKPGAAFAEKEIRDHCKQHLHDLKCPKEILFLDELPRNKMGKILKEEIVKYFRNLSSPHKEGS
jgi:malonyl-CoA/methylmalonyl-CoA synthetase